MQEYLGIFDYMLEFGLLMIPGRGLLTSGGDVEDAWLLYAVVCSKSSSPGFDPEINRIHDILDTIIRCFPTIQGLDKVILNGIFE